jgi:hypothetical protein
MKAHKWEIKKSRPREVTLVTCSQPAATNTTETQASLGALKQTLLKNQKTWHLPLPHMH